MKVVINTCFGGFGLSKLAVERLEAAGVHETGYSIDRDNVELVRIVEELGHEADGSHASLKVVTIPDDVEWFISEYDGSEHVAEKHRTWG